MKRNAPQTSVFDGLPGAEPVSLTQALTVSSAGDQVLSKEQLDFNKQLKRVEKLRDEIDALDAVASTERVSHAALLASAKLERTALSRALCMSLHERLQRKGLTARQRQDAETVLLAMASDARHNLDDEIQGMVKSYRSGDEADLDGDFGGDGDPFAPGTPVNEAIQQMREALTASSGISLADLPDNASPDEVMAAFQERLFAARAKSQADRDAQKAERKAKRKLTAKQLERQAADQILADAKLAEAKNAEAALRSVYRQLASELHPDREVDPVLRERKSALMSEVNAAYDKRDLMALLGLQLKIAQTDPDKLQAFASGRLAALKSLLADQYKSLTREKNVLVARLQDEFDIGWHNVVEANTLPALLNRQRREFGEANHMLADCLNRIGDDKWFKIWIKNEARVIEDMFQDQSPFGLPPGSPFGF